MCKLGIVCVFLLINAAFGKKNDMVEMNSLDQKIRSKLSGLKRDLEEWRDDFLYGTNYTDTKINGVIYATLMELIDIEQRESIARNYAHREIKKLKRIVRKLKSDLQGVGGNQKKEMTSLPTPEVTPTRYGVKSLPVSTTEAPKKECYGTRQGLVARGSSAYRYALYKRTFSKCTHVKNNLEMVFLEDEDDYNLDFLKDIEEVEGYVLIVGLRANIIPLVNLRVIHGQWLFLHKGEEYGLFIALNSKVNSTTVGLKELHLNSLTEMRGKAFFFGNNQLCYADTINWQQINPNLHSPVEFKGRNITRKCGECDQRCYESTTDKRHCWGAGPDMCQKYPQIRDRKRPLTGNNSKKEMTSLLSPGVTPTRYDVQSLPVSTTEAPKKECYGTRMGFTTRGDSAFRYKLYERTFSKCTHVRNNLEMVFLEREDDYNLDFLRDIKEVEGYVFIVGVRANIVPLVNLRVIHGKWLHSYHEDECGLFIALNYKLNSTTVGLKELQLNSLTEMRGKACFISNTQLCYADTINWQQINPNLHPPVEFKGHNVTRICGECDQSCFDSTTGKRHCWGAGPGMCQKFS